jgi:hypothetical protein
MTVTYNGKQKRINHLKPKHLSTLFKCVVTAAQKKHLIFIRVINWFSLLSFSGITFVYCEKHPEHVNILCCKNAHLFLMLKRPIFCY